MPVYPAIGARKGYGWLGHGSSLPVYEVTIPPDHRTARQPGYWKSGQGIGGRKGTGFQEHCQGVRKQFCPENVPEKKRSSDKNLKNINIIGGGGGRPLPAIHGLRGTRTSLYIVEPNAGSHPHSSPIKQDLPLIEWVTHQFRRDAFLLMARLLVEFIRPAVIHPHSISPVGSNSFDPTRTSRWPNEFGPTTLVYPLDLGKSHKTKRGAPFQVHPVLFYWWRRRESNPRPQVLCLRLYMLIPVY